MDSIGVEPGELTFKKVHTNYLKAKRSSSKRWLLVLLLSFFAIGTFTAWWFYNSNSQNKQLATTETINSNTTTNASNHNTENNSESINIDPNESISNNQNTETNNIKINSNSQTSSEATPTENKKKTDVPDDNANAVAETNKNSTEEIKNSSDKNETITVVRSASKKEKKNTSVERSKPSASVSKTNFNVNEPGSLTTTNKSKKNNSSKELTIKESKSPNEKQVTKTIPETDNTNRSNSDSKPLSDQKERSEPVNKNDTATALNSYANKINTPDQATDKIDTAVKNPVKKVNDPKTNDLLAATANPTNNLNTDKKNHFYINTELIYYNINYEAKPNGKAPSMYTQNNANFPKLFSDGNPKGSSKIISGAVSLGYTFKNNLSANLGISYFSVENKINGKAFAQNKTQLVLDYYLYDSTMQIIDTVYKVGSSRNINVVNGDTVEAQDYLNNIKYISIPINLSYKLNINPKFGIEPSLGIQYCLPLSSYQLIAVKDNTFTYGKTKNFMNPRAIFFDVAMKFNYALNPNSTLYVKPGYFFNNRSIYNVDYALDYRLKSLYIAFGLTLKLK